LTQCVINYIAVASIGQDALIISILGFIGYLLQSIKSCPETCFCRNYG